ncbi:hypothetical protein ACIA5D_50745 [Actinoplanes sp. NPDC051513]|uniref:hypothetical protein n=1 Tax=Actinoplanes sp. NPDC051513 TaxID=3363908 RepID=UPI0037BAD0E4
MSAPLRTTRRLGAVLVAAALLVAPSAAAAAPASPRTQATASPTLDSATIRGDNVVLIWSPPAGNGITDHAVFANGRFLFRTLSPDITTVFLASEGLSGGEVFTVAAEDSQLNQSPPSNGLKAVPPRVLPAPVLLSGSVVPVNPPPFVRVTLTWRASRSDQDVITYTIFATVNGTPRPVTSADNVTNLTFIPDPCGPIGSCPLTGREPYTVVASDRTLAVSAASNAIVPTPF